MERKPEIQYVGQFYVYGSEARQLEEKKRRQAKTSLPMAQLEKLEKLYVDPVALLGIAVAIFMVVAMVIGLQQIRKDWAVYNGMSEYVSQLNRENAELSARYRESFDLEDIQRKAVGIGMIPKEEAQTMTIRVRVPEPEAKPTMWEDIVWFWNGLFADARS